MSNYPINYSFVSKKSLAIKEEDGSVKEYAVLVLDDEANTAYFKKIESLQKTIENCPSKELTHWSMSPSFVDLAVNDLIREEFIEIIKNTGEPPADPTVFGLKVIMEDSETPVCYLHFENSKKIENTFWQ